MISHCRWTCSLLAVRQSLLLTSKYDITLQMNMFIASGETVSATHLYCRRTRLSLVTNAFCINWRWTLSVLEMNVFHAEEEHFRQPEALPSKQYDEMIAIITSQARAQGVLLVPITTLPEAGQLIISYNRCQVHVAMPTLWRKTILQCDWSFLAIKWFILWLPLWYQISPRRLIIMVPSGSLLGHYGLEIFCIASEPSG